MLICLNIIYSNVCCLNSWRIAKYFPRGRSFVQFLGIWYHITFFVLLAGDLLEDIVEKMSYILWFCCDVDFPNFVETNQCIHWWFHLLIIHSLILKKLHSVKSKDAKGMFYKDKKIIIKVKKKEKKEKGLPGWKTLWHDL